VAIGRLGLEGDGQADLSVHGGLDKAVYAIDESTTTYWRDRLGRPDLSEGCFGENLTLRGWPEHRVSVGDVFRIGHATLQVSQPRQPCEKLAMRFDDPGLPKRFFSSGRVGFYMRVLEEGSVAAGDVASRITAHPDGLAVDALVAIWLDRKASTQALARAVSNEALADAWREPLRDRLARMAARSPARGN